MEDNKKTNLAIRMIKKIIAKFGAGLLLTIISYLAWFPYVTAIWLLDWRAYIIFPILSGGIGWAMIYFFEKSQKTLVDVIEEKVKGKRKRFFLALFNSSKALAFIVSAIALGPYLTPIIIKSAVKNICRVYLYSIILNVLATAGWVWAYFRGLSLFEYIWNTIKLSLGA